MSQIKIKDNQGRPVADCNIRISSGRKSSDEADFDIETDSAGAQGWPIPHWPITDYTLHVNFRGVLDGYEAKSVYVPKPANGEYPDIEVTLTYAPVVTQLSRLHIEGTRFVNEEGERVFMKGATFFSGYWRFLEEGPESIRPSLEELKGLGCNMIRVFGMSFYVQQNLFGKAPFNPANYGNRFYDELPAFLALAAEYGMYVYFSVFPDNDIITPFHSNKPIQIEHWNRTLDSLRPCSNIILEVSNEPDAHGFNYIDPSMLAFPDFCPACPGSYGEGSDAYSSGSFPDSAGWGSGRSLGDLHPKRSYPAEIMDSMAVNNVYYLNGRALMIGEPDRFGSGGNPDVEKARLTAAAGQVGAVGIVFHTLQGQRCDVYDDTTRKCAEAFFSEFPR